jgi:hypothetical protein
MGIEVDGSEWKSFIFRMVGPADQELVMNQLRHHFIMDEPVNRMLGFTEERFAYLDLRIRIFLSHNLSFAALDKESGKVSDKNYLLENISNTLKPFILLCYMILYH